MTSRSRLAVTLHFVVNGAGISSFIARVPDVQASLGLSKATLGLVLGALCAGMVGGSVLAGRAIVGGGWAAATGFILVAGVPALPAALTGFALVGAGLGVTVPLAFSAAGRVSDTPGRGVAAVASVGYPAFLLGPPIIGVVSDAVGLPLAFAAVGVSVFALTTWRQPALHVEAPPGSRLVAPSDGS